MLDKLLDNARDYTTEGGVITVGLSDHINSVVLWVENEGPSLHIQDGVDAFQMFSGTRNDSTGSRWVLGCMWFGLSLNQWGRGWRLVTPNGSAS